MNTIGCASSGPVHCAVDGRREAVRRSGHLAGIDYVEVYPNRVDLCVHVFGVMPTALAADNVVIEGGASIRDIRVLRARFDRHDDGDTCLRVTVDRVGDFSQYCLCLVDVGAPTLRCSFDAALPAPMTRAVPAGIDPRYACATFSFRIDCPTDRDCVDAGCGCGDAPRLPPPSIDYLARDFTSFKRLMLDRMAATMPQWREQHLPDIGITLVELFAYVCDQYSYTLDAVATEAHLGTALQRISVRRHARLLDYRLHEGCNARAWVVLEGDQDLVGGDALRLADLRFATLPPGRQVGATGLVAWEQVQGTDAALVFEPIDLQGTGTIEVRAAHRAIAFHTWGQHGCCLPQGSTRATLRSPAEAALQLGIGDILVLEEVLAADSGLAAGADPRKRHAVRLVRVEPAIDPLDGTPLLEIEWDRRDALPFALRLSARTSAPDCRWVDVAVARGNVLLVDHGQTVEERDDGWCVGSEDLVGCCSCDGSVADMQAATLPLQVTLTRSGITHGVAAPRAAAPASALLLQDPREALPAIALDVARDGAWPGQYAWRPVHDLLSSAATDLHLVAEFDDDGLARLRFGDGQSGRAPVAGECFRARYRIGNGRAGNVGAESIVAMGVRGRSFDGITIRVRNPLAARGGTDREPVAEARRFAPHAYGRVAARAVVAADYAEIAAADPRLDGAQAELAWTGSGYEAVVALDVLARDAGDTTLQADTRDVLEAVRRIGHDLRCAPLHAVPLDIAVAVCVQPGYLRAEVAAAVAAALSARQLPGGALGLFHPDRLSFGSDVHASTLVAAVQSLEGVAHLRMTRFARADADMPAARRSFDEGVIPIGCDEIALLDGDINFPGRGTLRLDVEGGR